MIGDSWGVPFYSNGYNLRSTQHTEYRLKQLGYNVFNYSLNGGSMIDTIEYARYGIKRIELSTTGNEYQINLKRDTYGRGKGECDLIPIPNYNGEKIDYLVWFYTEALRDWNSHIGNYMLLRDLHDFCTKAVATYFLNLLNCLPKVKTVIIGGQAVVDDIFLNYYTPNYLIKDWKSQIFGKQLPNVLCLSRSDLVERASDPIEDKIKILDNHTLLYDLMLHSPLFPDNCHPGSELHEQLTAELHRFFQNDIGI